MKLTKNLLFLIFYFIITILLSISIFLLSRTNAQYREMIVEDSNFFKELFVANVVQQENCDSLISKITDDYNFIVFLPTRACSTCYYEFIARIEDEVGADKLLIIVEEPFISRNFSSLYNVKSFSQESWPFKSEALPFLLFKNDSSRFVFLYNENKLVLLEDLLQIYLSTEDKGV